VSVVNPTRVTYAGPARGRGNKADKADARLIAESAARERPPAYAPPRPEVRQLQALTLRRDDLRAAAAREKARLAAPGLPEAERASIRRTARFLAREADRVQAEAEALVAGCPDLRADRE
jgi:transposase